MNDPGLAEDHGPQVFGRRAECGGDGVGAASFGQPEGEHEPTRADGEDQREGKLDAGESGKVHRGEA